MSGSDTLLFAQGAGERAAVISALFKIVSIYGAFRTAHQASLDPLLPPSPGVGAPPVKPGATLGVRDR